jgi:hypothetical protein
LTSTGAKSGAQRINLVGYLDIDEKIYIAERAPGFGSAPTG